MAEIDANIWNIGLPVWAKPASQHELDELEVRLGLAIPEALRKQLAIQSFGSVALDFDNPPFQSRSDQWSNAIVDGLMELNFWHTADDDDWCDFYSGTPGLDLLVRIAGHSEDHLFLDYRECGRNGDPKVVYVDLMREEFAPDVIAETTDEFVEGIIRSKETLSDSL